MKEGSWQTLLTISGKLYCMGQRFSWRDGSSRQWWNSVCPILQSIGRQSGRRWYGKVRDTVMYVRKGLTCIAWISDTQLCGWIFKQKLDVQDYTMQIVQCTLINFVSAKDSTQCCNCLDLPVLGPEIPSFERYFSLGIPSMLIILTDA